MITTGDQRRRNCTKEPSVRLWLAGRERPGKAEVVAASEGRSIQYA